MLMKMWIHKINIWDYIIYAPLEDFITRSTSWWGNSEVSKGFAAEWFYQNFEFYYTVFVISFLLYNCFVTAILKNVRDTAADLWAGTVLENCSKFGKLTDDRYTLLLHYNTFLILFCNVLGFMPFGIALTAVVLIMMVVYVTTLTIVMFEAGKVSTRRVKTFRTWAKFKDSPDFFGVNNSIDFTYFQGRKNFQWPSLGYSEFWVIRWVTNFFFIIFSEFTGIFRETLPKLLFLASCFLRTSSVILRVFANVFAGHMLIVFIWLSLWSLCTAVIDYDHFIIFSSIKAKLMDCVNIFNDVVILMFRFFTSEFFFFYDNFNIASLYNNVFFYLSNYITSIWEFDCWGLLPYFCIDKPSQERNLVFEWWSFWFMYSTSAHYINGSTAYTFLYPEGIPASFGDMFLFHQYGCKLDYGGYMVCETIQAPNPDFWNFCDLIVLLYWKGPVEFGFGLYEVHYPGFTGGFLQKSFVVLISLVLIFIEWVVLPFLRFSGAMEFFNLCFDDESIVDTYRFNPDLMLISSSNGTNPMFGEAPGSAEGYGLGSFFFVLTLYISDVFKNISLYVVLYFKNVMVFFSRGSLAYKSTAYRERYHFYKKKFLVEWSKVSTPFWMYWDLLCTWVAEVKEWCGIDGGYLNYYYKYKKVLYYLFLDCREVSWYQFKRWVDTSRLGFLIYLQKSNILHKIVIWYVRLLNFLRVYVRPGALGVFSVLKFLRIFWVFEAIMAYIGINVPDSVHNLKPKRDSKLINSSFNVLDVLINTKLKRFPNWVVRGFPLEFTKFKFKFDIYEIALDFAFFFSNLRRKLHDYILPGGKLPEHIGGFLGKSLALHSGDKIGGNTFKEYLKSTPGYSLSFRDKYECLENMPFLAYPVFFDPKTAVYNVVGVQLVWIEEYINKIKAKIKAALINSPKTITLMLLDLQDNINNYCDTFVKWWNAFNFKASLMRFKNSWLVPRFEWVAGFILENTFCACIFVKGTASLFIDYCFYQFIVWVGTFKVFLKCTINKHMCFNPNSREVFTKHFMWRNHVAFIHTWRIVVLYKSIRTVLLGDYTIYGWVRYTIKRVLMVNATAVKWFNMFTAFKGMVFKRLGGISKQLDRYSIVRWLNRFISDIKDIVVAILKIILGYIKAIAIFNMELCESFQRLGLDFIRRNRSVYSYKTHSFVKCRLFPVCDLNRISYNPNKLTWSQLLIKFFTINFERVINKYFKFNTILSFFKFKVIAAELVTYFSVLLNAVHLRKNSWTTIVKGPDYLPYKSEKCIFSFISNPFIKTSIIHQRFIFVVLFNFLITSIYFMVGFIVKSCIMLSSVIKGITALIYEELYNNYAFTLGFTHRDWELVIMPWPLFFSYRTMGFVYLLKIVVATYFLLVALSGGLMFVMYSDLCYDLYSGITLVWFSIVKFGYEHFVEYLSYFQSLLLSYTLYWLFIITFFLLYFLKYILLILVTPAGLLLIIFELIIACVQAYIFLIMVSLLLERWAR